MIIILRNKSFSKSDPKPKLKERNGNPEIALGTLAISSTPIGIISGNNLAKEKISNKINKEVLDRIDEIGNRAKRGDKRAMEAMLRMNDPEVISGLSNLSSNNPRLRKAIRKGRIIGAAIPLITGGALIAKGISKNKKYNKSKKQYDKDIKAWRERNKKN